MIQVRQLCSFSSSLLTASALCQDFSFYTDVQHNVCPTGAQRDNSVMVN